MTIDIAQLRNSFEADGLVLLKNFYDVERDIAPVQEGIRQIVSLAARKHGVAADCSTSLLAMTTAYRSLICLDRSIGGVIYDAVKQIPAFVRLIADRRNTDLFAALRKDSFPAIAAGGYGIRIDNPGEEKFRAQWHQEFPAQLRSLDGLVFWSPLLPVTPEMGPVQILPRSHREGYLPVHDDGGGVGKSGAYALFMDREAEIVEKYSAIAPETVPGDLLIMDYLTVHQSGFNVSDRPRWSMQFRYFNFNEPFGQSIDWKGSFAAGQDFRRLLETNTRLGERP